MRWEERARAAMQEFVDRCDRGEVRSRYTYEKLKALLAEPAERQGIPGECWGPGSEIPGWLAAKRVSEGRAAEIEWRKTQWGEGRWENLSTHPIESPRAFAGDPQYRFRLRPAQESDFAARGAGGDDKLMDRIVVISCFAGLFGMRVCAEADVTDGEILEVCNRENPSGTSCGWSAVVREAEEGSPFKREDTLPVHCDKYPERLHFLVLC